MELLLSFEAWLTIGIILAFIELFVPGGILLNLGLASIIVAIGIKFGFLDSWVVTLTTWFISASFLLFVFSIVSNRLFRGEESIDNTDEDLDIYGKTVLVTETIGPGNQAGRVEFQGSSWSALSDGSIIQAGKQVTIICKDNISLIVEPQK